MLLVRERPVFLRSRRSRGLLSGRPSPRCSRRTGRPAKEAFEAAKGFARVAGRARVLSEGYSDRLLRRPWRRGPTSQAKLGERNPGNTPATRRPAAPALAARRPAGRPEQRVRGRASGQTRASNGMRILGRNDKGPWNAESRTRPSRSPTLRETRFPLPASGREPDACVADFSGPDGEGGAPIGIPYIVV